MSVRPVHVVVAVTALIGALFSASAGFAATHQSYIVVLDAGTRDVGATAADLARSHGGELGFVYQHALKGFSITTSPQAAAALARNPRVAYVETNDPVSIAAQATPTGVERIFAPGNTAIDIDDSDDLRVDVDVAVIDTGVDLDHPDLNVVGGVTCTASGGGPPWARRYTCTEGGDDDHYHGTHVAGTIGALDNGQGVVGVAPGARIWAVKVLNSNGSGYEAQVVAGIDWVAANAATIEVANMSLGGAGFSRAEYDAIQGAVDAGVAFAVAAGNDNDDAGEYSPAAFDNTLTVSALADFDGAPGGLGSPTCRTDADDTLADFSNWGSAVQLAAPGVCILSTYPLEQGGYGTISGTSMAAPHAAGALALLASAANPANAADVHDLYGRLIGAGNFDWIDDSGDGIHEPLLDVSDTSLFSPVLVPGDGGSGPINSPPTASFTYDCTELSCTFDGTGSSDSDGTLTSYHWDFGDGGTADGPTASHTFAAGTYTVTLVVTDDEGATGSETRDVTVVEPGAENLLASSTNNGKTWTARVTDSNGGLLTGTWDYGVGECSDATCTLSGIPKKQNSVTFTSAAGGSLVVSKP